MWGAGSNTTASLGRVVPPAHGGPTATSTAPSLTATAPSPAATLGNSPAEDDAGEHDASPVLPGGSSVSPGSSLPAPSRPKTRLQNGIVKPKQYTDGTIRWCNACVTGKEPSTVQEALHDPLWKQAMQDEYDALIWNGT